MGWEGRESGKTPTQPLGSVKTKLAREAFQGIRLRSWLVRTNTGQGSRERQSVLIAPEPRRGPKLSQPPHRPLFEHPPPSTSSPPSIYLPTLPLSAPEQAGQTYMAAGSHQSKDQRSQLAALQSLWTGCRELRQRPRERPGRGAPGAGPQHPATTCQQPSLEQRPQ